MGSNIGGFPDERARQRAGFRKHDALGVVRDTYMGIPHPRRERIVRADLLLLCAYGGSHLCIRSKTSGDKKQVARRNPKGTYQPIEPFAARRTPLFCKERGVEKTIRNPRRGAKGAGNDGSAERKKTIKNPRFGAEYAVNEIGARGEKMIRSTAQNKLEMKYARGKTFRAFF